MINKQATSERQTRILISGAGIAGLTLAYWLDRYGFQVAVVEKRPEMSHAGYMMDFYGSGYDVAEKMGILDELQSQRYPLSGLTIVDHTGKVQSTVSMDSFKKLLKGRYVNVMHGNLTQVLYTCIKDRVSVRFGCTIMAINPMPDAVRVELSDDTRETYDLLIGADGVHSKVRSLLWGAESQFDHFLGFYIACAVIDN